MKNVVADKYRDIDFSRAKRGAVVKPEPGKTKISIRLDNGVLEYFRTLVDTAGGGNYQTLINDALLKYVHRRSTVDVLRQAVREDLAPYGIARRANPAPQRTAPGTPLTKTLRRTQKTRCRLKRLCAVTPLCSL